MINIEGLNKAELLAALYNASKPQGLGFLHFRPEPMTKAQAEQEIQAATQQYGGKTSIYFDYLHGRVMKVELGGVTLNPALYDRDLGDGAAQGVVDKLPKESPIEAGAAP